MNRMSEAKASVNFCLTMDSARIWAIYPRLVTAIKGSHDEVGLKGHHDIYHAMRVGDIAYRIALETWNDLPKAHLSGIAGLCHNADRILGVVDSDPFDGDVARLIQTWLEVTDLNESDCRIVIDAVLAHDQKNSLNDSDVLVALKDADRTVNLDLDVIMRTGQHHSTLPTVDYRYFTSDPLATFKRPGSVVRLMEYVLEWVDSDTDVCVRTKAGYAMASQRAKLIRSYLDSLKEQLQLEGIFPAPF